MLVAGSVAGARCAAAHPGSRAPAEGQAASRLAVSRQSGQSACVTDIPYPTELERLRNNIRAELHAQRALRDLDLDDATLDGLADGITSNVDYGFSVKWEP